ncbi:MAG: HEAT repeat domain-containing protein, partial [Pyrinomonadaceae bacterium]
GQDRPAVKLDANVEAAVIRLTKHARSSVRGDALELLGETQDKKHSDRLLAGLNDRSYEVIDQSALAIARAKDPRAFDALSKLTTTASWKGRIQSAGLSGLGELGDKRAFDIGFKAATDKTLPTNARAAALVIVGATGKGDPRAYPLIFEKFKSSFDTSNIPGIISGIQAIVKLADPRGQEAFDLLKVKFKDNPGAMQFVNGQEAEFKAALKP